VKRTSTLASMWPRSTPTCSFSSQSRSVFLFAVLYVINASSVQNIACLDDPRELDADHASRDADARLGSHSPG
jgi:hypothetical protein